MYRWFLLNSFVATMWTFCSFAEIVIFCIHHLQIVPNISMQKHVNLVGVEKCSKNWGFCCKIWRRYSRERTLQSLGDLVSSPEPPSLLRVNSLITPIADPEDDWASLGSQHGVQERVQRKLLQLFYWTRIECSLLSICCTLTQHDDQSGSACERVWVERFLIGGRICIREFVSHFGEVFGINLHDVTHMFRLIRLRVRTVPLNVLIGFFSRKIHEREDCESYRKKMKTNTENVTGNSPNMDRKRWCERSTVDGDLEKKEKENIIIIKTTKVQCLENRMQTDIIATTHLTPRFFQPIQPSWPLRRGAETRPCG